MLKQILIDINIFEIYSHALLQPSRNPDNSSQRQCLVYFHPMPKTAFIAPKMQIWKSF